LTPDAIPSLALVLMVRSVMAEPVDEKAWEYPNGLVAAPAAWPFELRPNACALDPPRERGR